MAALIPCGRNNQHSKSDADSEESNLFNKLCDELVSEILVRLPTSTTAVQFKVVCKRWYSLISSSHFIARFIHLRHNRDVESSVVFQFDYTRTFGRLHSDFLIIPDCSLLRNVSGDGWFSLSFLPRSPSRLRLEGSFADLILCSSLIDTVGPGFYQINYYVSKLLTRQLITLPPAPAYEFLVEAVSIGILFSECKHKFTVVRLHTCEYLKPCSQFRVQVFSSEHGQWRTLVVSYPLAVKPYDFMCPLVAYRGMLHYLFPNGIAVYDPFNTPETFSRIIHLPFKLRDFNGCFGVCQDRLRVVEVTGKVVGDLVVNVWELEDYDSGLLNLVHKVYIQHLTYNRLHIAVEGLKRQFYPFTVPSLHPKSGDEVFLRIDKGVALVNLKTRIIERYYPTPLNENFCWVNAFYLADQWWPTQVSSLLQPNLES